MAESAACISSAATAEEPLDQGQTKSQSTVKLKLRHPKSKKKVVWTNETVDNEHLNKKKSKCCCIYEKPHAFGESSSDTEDECDHCRGHTDDKKKHSPDQSLNPVEPDILQTEN